MVFGKSFTKLRIICASFKFSNSFAHFGPTIFHPFPQFMFISRNGSELNKYLQVQKELGKKVGFVATMGALHDGHLSLIELAKRENDLVICSIFVNPTQFNNPEDLKKYPRNEKRDIDQLESVHCDIAYIPEVSDIYGDKPTSVAYDFGTLASDMEGKYRPGHFAGVGTVVHRLFEILIPDRAYFGEKDYQQLLVVKKLAEIENLPVEVIGGETRREPSGLAMSSRNERLSDVEKNEAAIIYQKLQEAREQYPYKPLSEISTAIAGFFADHPTMDLEYFFIVNGDDLQPLQDKQHVDNPRAFIAVYVRDVRLLDNISLN